MYLMLNNVLFWWLVVFCEHTVLSESHHPAPATRPVSAFIWAALTFSRCEKGWQLILSALRTNTKAGFPACCVFFFLLLHGDEGLYMKRCWLIPAVSFAAEDGSQLKCCRHSPPREPEPNSWSKAVSLQQAFPNPELEHLRHKSWKI